MNWSRIRDALKMVEIAVEALEMIRGLAQARINPLDALQAIGAIVESLHDGFTEKTTPDVVRDELCAIRDRAFSTSGTSGVVDEKFDRTNTED